MKDFRSGGGVKDEPLWKVFLPASETDLSSSGMMSNPDGTDLELF